MTYVFSVAMKVQHYFPVNVVARLRLLIILFPFFGVHVACLLIDVKVDARNLIKCLFCFLIWSVHENKLIFHSLVVILLEEVQSH